MKKITIAIDGFSSTGKSTLAKQLAQKLQYIYVDSGAMYRAVALYTLQNNLIENNELNTVALINNLPNINISFQYNERLKVSEIYLNGVNAVDLYNTWDNVDHHTKIIYSEDFYNTIFKNSANVSDFITMEANYAKSNDGKKPTQDHFQVARIAIRALMEYNRPLLLDTEKFLDVCKTLRTVVRVTSDQNNEVKYSWKKKQIK